MKKKTNFAYDNLYSPSSTMLKKNRDMDSTEQPRKNNLFDEVYKKKLALLESPKNERKKQRKRKKKKKKIVNLDDDFGSSDSPVIRDDYKGKKVLKADCNKEIREDMFIREVGKDMKKKKKKKVDADLDDWDADEKKKKKKKRRRRKKKVDADDYWDSDDNLASYGYGGFKFSNPLINRRIVFSDDLSKYRRPQNEVNKGKKKAIQSKTSKTKNESKVKGAGHGKKVEVLKKPQKKEKVQCKENVKCAPWSYAENENKSGKRKAADSNLEGKEEWADMELQKKDKKRKLSPDGNVKNVELREKKQ